ncbi:MAG: GerMN domain-containing protein [Eubacterium sp.]
MRQNQIRLFVMIFVVLATCCSCQRTVNPDQKGNIVLYQMAEDGSRLLSSEYEIQADKEDNVSVIQELLDCFKKRVDIRDFQLKEKQLTIEFLSSYYNQDKIDEVLTRAAIVKTICQLDSVEYVEFYIGENPLMVNGEAVGIMSKLSFLDSVGGEGYTQEKYVTLYFASNNGTKMQEISTKLMHDMTVPLARLLVEQLLKGPDEIVDANTSEVRDTIPTDTKLNSLTIRDHVCYVDFSKEFMNMQADVNSSVVIYSIVNTLCELSDVSKVQFTIDGEQEETYGDVKNFTGSFERNLDMVQDASKG